VEPINFLDEIVARFRDRWETSPAYRARMSGVIGLAVLMGICSCMVIASLIANSAFASVGFGSGGGGPVAQQQNGGGGVDVAQTFPTSAIPTWDPQDTPVSAVAPTSNATAPTPTPIPTATDIATSTPCYSGCGGGGGGGGGVIVSITGWTPGRWNACSSATPCYATVHTSVPSTPFNINYTGCNNAPYPAYAQGTTDANGNYTFTVTVGAGTAIVRADLWPSAPNDKQELHGNPPC
jgi:hypothetical protein